MPKQSSKIGMPTVRTIALLDDHPVILEAIKDIIEESDDLTVGWNGSDPVALWNFTEKSPPDLIVLELVFDDADGLDLAKSFSVRWPDVPILIFSMHDEKLYAERALKAGARGYLMKSAPLPTILEAMREVANGDLYLSDRMKKAMITGAFSQRRKPGTSSIERLTNRELEVFNQIGRGKSMREIAKTLGVSIKTVETYRSQIKEKLDITRANQLVIYASEWFRHGSTPRFSQSKEVSLSPPS